MGVVHIQGDSTKNQSFKSGFMPKTEGWYDVKIDEVQPWAGDGTKTPASILKCTIVFADNGKHLGEKISNFISHAPNQAGRWRVLLDQLGVNYALQPNQDGSEGPLFDTDHLVGRHVRVKIVHNPGKDGKVYENWDEVAQSRYNMQVQGGPSGYVQPPQGGQYVQPPQGGYAPPSHMPGQGQPPPRQG